MADLRRELEDAVARQRAGDHEGAVEGYERILRRHPDEPNATHLLALSERALGHPLAALRRLERAHELAPAEAAIVANLGTTCQMVGRHDDAVRHLERAIVLAPDVPGYFANRLLAEHYRPGVTLDGLDRLHRQWDARFARPVRRTMPAAAGPGDPDLDPGRPLRLGFVSPDLGVHPVGIFLVGLLEHLPRPDLHATCYALRRWRDPIGRRIESAADAWVDAETLAEPALAARIARDRIDVLFDLCGHTQANRIRTFVLRPAPLQATWMGYVGTTGLAEMDLLVADPHQVPAGREDAFRERVVRLPDDYVILDPPVDAPEVVPPPCAAGAPPTFGSFNNPSKLNPPLLDLWARVLDAVPGSTLFLKYAGFGDAAFQAELREAFRARGIDPSRLRLEGRAPRAELLAAYGEVDVCLDPHPYSGGLTTLEALWMGVPVVTRPGETFASRHALSHLHAVGEAEGVAADDDGYVAAARALVADPAALAAARAGRRARMAASPACDAPRYAAAVSAMVRDAWRERCAAGR